MLTLFGAAQSGRQSRSIGTAAVRRCDHPDACPCENRPVTDRRLPWLLALPLMVAGSVAAHLVGYAVVPATPEHATGEGGELGGFHERASQGVAGHTVLLLGLAASLIGVVCIRALLARVRGRESRRLGAGCFFLLPLIAYSSQELLERLLHAESFPFQAVLEPRFLLGLALQLPFAAAAFVLAWLLLAVGARLLRFLGRPPSTAPHALPPQLWAPTTVASPRVRALSRGHPLRGPPLLA
jgi:hypothetical protein